MMIRPELNDLLNDPAMSATIDSMLKDNAEDLGRPVTIDEIEIRWDWGKAFATCTVCLKDWGEPKFGEFP